jgi:hypothetical protein
METPQTVIIESNNMEPIKVKKVKKVKKTKTVDTESVESTEPTEQVVKPKKKSKSSVKDTSSTTTEAVSEQPKKAVSPSKFTDELIYLPVPRVRKYINNTKVNKTVEDLLSQIKECQTTGVSSLDTILSDKFKEVVGVYMENRELTEAKYAKLNKTDFTKMSDLSEFEVALSAISKLKYKFSNDSFQVVSIVLDQIVMEITDLTIKNVLLSKKTTLNKDFSVKNDYQSGKLYALYGKTKTYMDLISSVNETTEVDTSVETVADSEPTTPSVVDKVDFKFHIRKIVNKLKHYNEDYSSIKISNKYCEFCSDVIFDILDRVVSILMVLVDTIHNKTITKNLFISVFKIILIDNGVCDSVTTELFDKVESVMTQLKDKKGSSTSAAAEAVEEE